MNGYDYGLAESVQAYWLGLVEHDWLCPLLKSRDVLEAFLRKTDMAPEMRFFLARNVVGI